MCKNVTRERWKIEEVRFYFDYLNCLMSIRPEEAGTLVQVSVVPGTPPHFFSFSIVSLCWLGKRAGGEQKIIMYRGTPAHFFFQCVKSFSSKLCLR